MTGAKLMLSLEGILQDSLRASSISTFCLCVIAILLLVIYPEEITLAFHKVYLQGNSLHCCL